MKINREQVVASIMKTLTTFWLGGHGETLILAEVDGVQKEGSMSIKQKDDESLEFAIHFPDEGDGYTINGTIDVVLPWVHAFHN